MESGGNCSFVFGGSEDFKEEQHSSYGVNEIEAKVEITISDESINL